MHLTNYAVNKRNKDFLATEAIDQHDEGSKRSASAVFRQIEQAHGVSTESLWSKVAKLSANTLMALRPGLVEFYVHEQPRQLHPLAPKGFQIIGLDILFDSEVRPLLLELNANPSLSVMQPAAAAAPAEREPTPPTDVQEAPTRPGAGARRSHSLRSTRQRLGLANSTAARETSVRLPPVISPLDLEIKRELVSQALLLVQPAPMSKVARLRKKWQQKQDGMRDAAELPLDDDGAWALPWKPTACEAVRPDAPGRSPALEALHFDELVAPDVLEYARAHLSIYRCWSRNCGMQETLGQAQVLKLLERGGVVSDVFQDKVSAQLWLTRIWRSAAVGAFGLSFPRFVCLASRIGKLLIAGCDAPEDEEDAPSHIQGVLEFVRRGLCL